MEFKLNETDNSVEIRFRKGIYSESEIDECLGSLGKDLRAKKKETSCCFIVLLKPNGKTDLKQLAWGFSNTVIAAVKQGL